MGRRKLNRRSIRLKGYDYSQAGAYFITICTQNRECLLGKIIHDKMVLNKFGQIAVDTWRWLEKQYDHVVLDQWVVMPNHLHGIILIHGRDDSRIVPTHTGSMKKRKPIGRLVGAFKTVSTKQINIIRNTAGEKFWQRNYYERIVRNDNDLNRIRQYIVENPMKWAIDRENIHEYGL